VEPLQLTESIYNHSLAMHRVYLPQQVAAQTNCILNVKFATEDKQSAGRENSVHTGLIPSHAARTIVFITASQQSFKSKHVKM
jgi:hypothetical protein